MRSSRCAPTLLMLTLVSACTASDMPTAPVASPDVGRTTASAEVNQPPKAYFSWTCTDRVCDFTNGSTDSDGVITSSYWQFGDGWTSNEHSPSHVYADYRTYTVTLEVTDDDGAKTAVSATVILHAPSQGPAASFVASCTDLGCDFTDTSTEGTGTIVDWSWDFGDGGSSSEQSPSHTYAAPGTYTVTLTATAGDGLSDGASQDVTVSSPLQAPSAAFTSSCTDLACLFTDMSTDGDGSVVSWLWDFGDGATSPTQNPGHTYAAAGTYTVTLTVTDDDGASGSVAGEVTAVEGNRPPTAGFTSTCTDLSCSFTDTSSDADGSVVQWSWDFGDGGASTAQNPDHTYAATGTYTVTLTVTDDDGAGATTSGTVSVEAPSRGITLTAVGYWVDDHKMVDLTWSGATTDEVDVFRNGWLAGTIPNDGSNTHELNVHQPGSYEYKVCEAGTSVCSPVVTLVF